MAYLLTDGRFKATDDAGAPLVGGLLYTYVSGTTTPLSTYTDATLATPNTNPVVLNSRGEAQVWLGAGTYTFVIKTSTGVQIWSVDGVVDSIPAINASISTLQTNVSSLQTSTAAMATDISTLQSNVTTLQSIDNDLLQQSAASLSAGTAVNMACFGDSTMWGADPANLNNQVSPTPPQALQNFVNNYYGNLALSVTNAAISGTTATQMIAGTDGSGATFDARMSVSGAAVVFCNHGVNDAFGVNATSLSAYKTALLSFVQTCRKYSKVPVLVTPFPCLTIGTFGSQDRVEATARFAETMRQIAANHGVKLIDQHKWIRLLLGVNGVLPLATLPDGVHGAATTYGRFGNNLAEAVLGAQMGSFTRPGQRITVAAPLTRATSQTFSTGSSSRVGVIVTTGTATPQTMRAVFRVDDAGMDLYFAGQVFSEGSDSITLNIDGLATIPFSQKISGFTPSAGFWQDFETLIVRDCPPGFHVLLMTTSTTGGIGLSYLKTRPVEKPVILPSASVSPTPSQRTLVAKKLELSAAGSNSMFLCDSIPMSRLLDGYEFEFTAQLQKSSGVIIGGNTGTNLGAANAERAVTFGLNSSGFMTINEATAPGTYSATVIGGVDLSTASHNYRISVTSAGVATVFVDDTQVGTTTALTQPYFGGFVGVWKNTAGGSLIVSDVCRVWRL